MDNSPIEKIKTVITKDFTKITNQEAEEIFDESVTSEIYSLAKISRGLTRIFMLAPCNWNTDFKDWTDDDKIYAKKLLIFLLDANGFQNIKA